MCFHTNCKLFCSSSVKNAIGNLIGVALTLQIAYDIIVIFTILILAIQENENQSLCYGCSFLQERKNILLMSLKSKKMSSAYTRRYRTNEYTIYILANKMFSMCIIFKAS